MASTTNSRLRRLTDLGLPERYEVRRRIASGGMASVWCAHDTVLGRDVAIKLLSEPFASDPAAIRRFKREARAAARLSSHPHVVTIYDVGETPAPDGGSPRTFLVMEHLPGGTVADAVRVDAVVGADVLAWVGQAASALDFAHEKGVLHRDIKPANFLLDGQRTLFVADFGIAQIGTEATLTGGGEMLGTAAYLAPERALGHPATESSDIYSLVVAAYELLVGERPFTSGQFATQARQHVEDEPPPASRRNPSLPRAVDAVLTKGLAKQPEKRWASAGSFADALEGAFRPARARRIVVAAGPRTARTRRLPAVAAAGAEPAEQRHSEPPHPEPSHSQPPRPARGRSGPSRLGRRLVGIGVAVATLAAAALAVGSLQGGSSHTPSTRAEAGTQTRSTHRATASSHSTQRRRPAAAPTSSAAGTTSPPVSTTPTNTTSTSTPSPTTADALEASGHALMQGGDYAGAVGLLRQAVNAAPPGSLTYAYALYDLGRSLRLSGDPRAAVTVLWKRMKIPNQTGVVRQELQAALQALGAATNGKQPSHAGGTGSQPPKDQGAGRGRSTPRTPSVPADRSAPV